MSSMCYRALRSVWSFIIGNFKGINAKPQVCLLSSFQRGSKFQKATIQLKSHHHRKSSSNYQNVICPSSTQYIIHSESKLRSSSRIRTKDRTIRRPNVPQAPHHPLESHPSSSPRYHETAISNLPRSPALPATISSNASSVPEERDLCIRSSHAGRGCWRGIGCRRPRGSYEVRGERRSARAPLLLPAGRARGVG